MYQRSSIMVEVDLSAEADDDENQSQSSFSSVPSILSWGRNTTPKAKARRKLIDSNTKMMFHRAPDHSEEHFMPLLPTRSNNIKSLAKSKEYHNHRDRTERLATFAMLAFLTLAIFAIFDQLSSVNSGSRRAPTLEELQRQERGLEFVEMSINEPSRTLEASEDDEEKTDPDDPMDISNILGFDLGQRMKEWLAKKQLSDGYFFTPLDDPNESFAFKPYSAKEIINTIPHFKKEMLLVMYSNENDEFIVLLPGRAEQPPPECVGSCVRIQNIMTTVLYAFRNRYFQRFQAGASSDLLFLISTAESPPLSSECLARPKNCGRRKTFAPILHFGSGFADGEILPSLMTMPLPTPNHRHLQCMAEWQVHKEVCQYLEPKRVGRDGVETKGLVFGEHIQYNAGGMNNAHERGGIIWEDLINQVVWRGTDSSYLTLLNPDLRHPDYDLDVEPKEKQYSPGTEGTIRALNDVYNILRPRWKAVVLTAQAEFDADKNANPKRKKKEVPWANMKFTSVTEDDANNPIKADISQNKYYQQWQELGIPAIGESMTSEELAHYKYHIDLGGDSGTTWEGTIQKLAMPGLLFHHSTGAVDWFHEHLVPWIHYVPVKEDLSDLREQYEWAEGNERKARKIAKAGTEFVRRMGRPEGMEELYRRHFLRPLEGIMEQYRAEEEMPMELLNGEGEDGHGMIFKEVMRCSGHNVDDCMLLQ